MSKKKTRPFLVDKPVIQPTPPAAPAGPEAGAVRAGQRAAVRVLAGLLQSDLPVASWRVHDQVPCTLSAQIAHWRDDEAGRAAQVRAWAAALDATARWEPYTHTVGEHGALRLQAEVEGVPVTVWTPLSTAPAAGTGADRPGPAQSGADGRAALREVVAVLGGLLEADRPVASWAIGDQAGLSGHIYDDTPQDAADRTAAVNLWATALGLTPRWLPFTEGQGGSWGAVGSVQGIRVQVWTWLAAAPAATTETAAGAVSAPDECGPQARALSNPSFLLQVIRPVTSRR